MENAITLKISKRILNSLKKRNIDSQKKIMSFIEKAIENELEFRTNVDVLMQKLSIGYSLGGNFKRGEVYDRD